VLSLCLCAEWVFVLSRCLCAESVFILCLCVHTSSSPYIRNEGATCTIDGTDVSVKILEFGHSCPLMQHYANGYEAEEE